MLKLSLVLDPNEDVSEGFSFVNDLKTPQSVLTVSDLVWQSEFISACPPPCLLCCLFSLALLSLRQDDEQLIGTVLTGSEAEVLGMAGRTADRNKAFLLSFFTCRKLVMLDSCLMDFDKNREVDRRHLEATVFSKLHRLMGVIGVEGCDLPCIHIRVLIRCQCVCLSISGIGVIMHSSAVLWLLSHRLWRGRVIHAQEQVDTFITDQPCGGLRYYCA